MMREILFLISLWVFFVGGFFLFVRGFALNHERVDDLWQEPTKDVPWPEERRQYQRRHLPFPVNYASLEQADFQEKTLTQDVGKGGVRFPARYPLRQGSRLYLSINVPKKPPLSLFGEVVWQNPHLGSPSGFDTGIKFVALSTSNIIKIARHL